MPPVDPTAWTAHPAVLERVASLVATPAESDLVVDRWIQRFTAVADRKLRRVVLAGCVGEADDGTLVGALHRVETRAELGDNACRWLVTELALTPSVLLELPYDRVVELYVAARDSGLPDIARRFLGGAEGRAAPSIDNPHLDRSAGERTALARTTDRLTLDRLAFDRDPRVIAALLDNPRTTERDAVRVAAMRPTNPEVLQLLAAHPKWSQRYRVRKALAFNPYTSPPLARQLLPTLLRQDLVAMVASGVLAEELRAAVRIQLDGRG